MLVRQLSLIFIFLFCEFSEGLTLTEALRIIKNHSEQKVSDLTLEQGRKTKNKSYANLLPSVSLTSRQSAQTANDLHSADPNWGWAGSLNLFAGLGDYHNIRQARAIYRASEAQRELETLDKEMTVAQLYIECLYYQKSEQSSQESYQTGLQIADIARRRYDRGLSSRDDYLKLKVDAETSQVRVISERAKKDNCYTELKYWVGQFVKLEPIALLQPPLVHDPKSFPDNHPKYVFYKESVEKDKFYARVLLSQNLPRVDLEYTQTYGPLTQEPDKTWWLKGTWTLFDSAQDWYNTQIQRIEMEKSEARLESIEKSLIRDSETLHRTFKENLKQYKILEDNLTDIKSTFRTSLNRFRAGAISSNDVAVDQSRVILATYSLNDMWLNRNLSAVRYQISLGKSVQDLLR